jgi:hypothetical protein
MYKCGWQGCEKAYGTLNHLNAHVTMQGHGTKRTPEGMRHSRVQAAGGRVANMALFQNSRRFAASGRPRRRRRMLARLLLRTRSVSVRLRLPLLLRTAAGTLRDPITSPRRRTPAPALSSCLRSDTSRVGMPARLLPAFSSRCPSTIIRTTRPHPRTARKIHRCTIPVSLRRLGT